MKKIVAAMAVAALTACAPAGNPDRLEPLNRQIFAFNEVLDDAVLGPVAEGYRYVTTEKARKGVRNATRNLGEPVVMLNAALQGDVEHFFTSGWRFVLNSTVGLAGFYDFAGEYAGLEYRREDFGQTMAVWEGDAESTYLVLPIFGPSTTRDAFGRVVDAVSNPWYHSLKTGESIGITAVDAIASREEVIDTLDGIYETSFDPYATIRSAYLQRRKADIINRNRGQE